MAIDSIVGPAERDRRELFELGLLGEIGAGYLGESLKVLKGSEALNSTELTQRISDHLLKEGRTGSSEYIGVLFISALLDNELKMAAAGSYDHKRIEELGLPVLIDMERTTPEIISEGRVVLVQEARDDLLGAVNKLKYALDTYIVKTAQRASEYYSIELTRKKTFLERIREAVATEPEPFEIPFHPNEAESERLDGLYDRQYLNREELQKTFQRELEQMMRQRPGMIGLLTTASASRYLGEISEDLGGKITDPIPVDKIRYLHTFMRGKGMAELNIYPGFGNAIEESVKRDLIAVHAVS